jgi:hypothetical protein
MMGSHHWAFVHMTWTGARAESRLKDDGYGRETAECMKVETSKRHKLMAI